MCENEIRRSEENMKAACQWIEREVGFGCRVTVVGLGFSFDLKTRFFVNGFVVIVPESKLVQMIEGIKIIRLIVDELHRFRIHPCPRESVLSPEVIGDPE